MKIWRMCIICLIPTATRNKLRICNTHCFFSAMIIAGTFLNVRLYSDQNVSVHLMITVQKTHKNIYSNNPHTPDGLKMAITKYIRNVDSAILNTVFGNTVRRGNKCLQTGGGTL
jgi:hypothetical protein